MTIKVLRVLGVAAVLSLTWLGLVNAAPVYGREGYRAPPARAAHYEGHRWQPPHYWHHHHHYSYRHY